MQLPKCKILVVKCTWLVYKINTIENEMKIGKMSERQQPDQKQPKARNGSCCPVTLLKLKRIFKFSQLTSAIVQYKSLDLVLISISLISINRFASVKIIDSIY